MSIVRYVNKKTGSVALYESTSHYDPETKQSRPKRKYLGTEDPVTGELIPSSGKRGRKKKTDGSPEKNNKPKTDYKYLYETLKKESADKDAMIKRLKHDNDILYSDLQRLKNIISDMLESKQLSNCRIINSRKRYGSNKRTKIIASKQKYLRRCKKYRRWFH